LPRSRSQGDDLALGLFIGGMERRELADGVGQIALARAPETARAWPLCDLPPSAASSLQLGHAASALGTILSSDDAAGELFGD
jgi:hypothetical protein